MLPWTSVCFLWKLYQAKGEFQACFLSGGNIGKRCGTSESSLRRCSVCGRQLDLVASKAQLSEEEKHGGFYGATLKTITQSWTIDRQNPQDKSVRLNVALCLSRPQYLCVIYEIFNSWTDFRSLKLSLRVFNPAEAAHFEKIIYSHSLAIESHKSYS